jgi:hypothetical protein
VKYASIRREERGNSTTSELNKFCDALSEQVKLKFLIVYIPDATSPIKSHPALGGGRASRKTTAGAIKTPPPGMATAS